MNPRTLMARAAGLILPLLLLCAATWVTQPGAWRPHMHTETLTHSVYAYRQWQSVGVKVNVGDRLTLRASGKWSYSPFVGMHGPEGGGLPVTVSTYPVRSLNGGVLLGRIGENGEPFYVGRGTTHFAQEAGLLFFRINDDLLGDNVGQLKLEIAVAPAPE